MKNFFVGLAVLIGAAFIAKADCPCGTRFVESSYISCDWYAVTAPTYHLEYLCYNQGGCEIIEPKEADYPVCETGAVTPADMDRQKPRFGIEVDVDKRNA